MPKIDMEAYNQAEASTGGDFERLPAGGYVVEITAVRTEDDRDGTDYVADKQYVKLIYDIAEGEYEGYYSDSFYDDKDYAHQVYFSWKNLGALKGNVKCLEESNPGFDAMAALNADAWEQYIGKKVGLVLGLEEYVSNSGEVRTRFGFPRMKTVDAIREGKFQVPELKKLDESERPADTADDVPF